MILKLNRSVFDGVDTVPAKDYDIAGWLKFVLDFDFGNHFVMGRKSNKNSRYPFQL